MAAKSERVRSLADFLRGKGVKCDEVEGLISLRVGLEGMTMRIVIAIDPNGESAHIAVSEIARVPVEKRGQVYKALNEANLKYRWLKFFIESDGGIIADADTQLCGGKPNEMCLRLVEYAVSVLDDAYPGLMKAIFA